MKALVDGDILVYRCAFAAEKTRYTLLDREEGIVIGQFDSAAEYKEYAAREQLEDYDVEPERVYGPLSHALSNVKTTVEHIREKLNPEEMIIILSDGKGFRDGLATIKKYKGNRDDAPRPKWYQEVRDYLVKRYEAIIYESVEADDVLALCQSEDTCIVSIDKDLLQVPGKHYNWVKDEKRMVTPESGLRRLYAQVLTGDSTDNIPGIRGIGPVKAEKILKDVEATKAELSKVCTAEWDKYLQTEADGFTYDEGTVSYAPWVEGLPCTATPEQIAAEVFQLVQVGGSYAEEALKEAGETLPRSISEEG